MTQIERIFEIFDNSSEEEFFNSRIIQQETNFPLGSIRRVLSELARDNNIIRVRDGLFVRIPKEESDPKQYRRKYVSGIFYCQGGKMSHYALTFEDNDIDRSQYLINELEEEFSDRCSEMRDYFGYSEQDTQDIPNDNQIYPNVEVGTL